MSNKQDREFLVQAADPKLRSAAIAAISKRRTILCWAVAIMTIGLLVGEFAKEKMSAFSAFAVSFAWILLYKSDSDLKLLQIVEQFRRDENRVA